MSYPLYCDTCGRSGSTDDAIEPGGPCQDPDECPGTILVHWEDVDAATYTADATEVYGHHVLVCLDDEGPLRPAFFWTIDNDMTMAGNNGWSSSVEQAKADSIAWVLDRMERDQ